MCEERSSLNRRTTAKFILIVEDDADISVFLQEAIKLEPHHHALIAVDGNHALEVVRQVKPDLFLLDYYLDKMTGIDLYHQLHATDGLEDIPAIILSASLTKHIKEIDDHHLVGMSKPVDLDELLTTITKLLEARNENTIREPM
jgi:DNA-binding response OmpR family regulator